MTMNSNYTGVSYAIVNSMLHIIESQNGKIEKHTLVDIGEIKLMYYSESDKSIYIKTPYGHITVSPISYASFQSLYASIFLVVS